MHNLFDSLLASEETALSVSELALQVKRVVESDPILCDVAVTGEIPTLRRTVQGIATFR